MKATLQVKMSIDKAVLLEERVEKLRKTARALSDELRRKLKTVGGAAQAEALERAEQLELSATTTNLLRAMVDFGIQKLLTAPDITLLATLHSVRVTQGRPPHRTMLARKAKVTA